MRHFEFYCPVKIIAGSDALEKLHFLCFELLGASKPMVVTDEGIVSAGLLDKLLSSLKASEYAVYSDVPPDSSLEVVQDIYRLYRSQGCDMVLALGGGSVIDTAKGLCLVASAGGKDISELQGVDTVRDRRIPFVVVPSTCGTGSEVSWVAVIEDRRKNRKLAFAASAFYPDAAVLVPEMIATLPSRLVAATSMDALTHAIEAYTGVQKNPVSDAFALSAIRIIFARALKGVAGDGGAKFELLVASTLAGMAFSNSMVGMVHSVSHAVGGVCGVPHGVANAILLPHVMRYNAGKSAHVAQLYSEIFRYLTVFVRDVAGKTLVDAVEALEDRLKEEAGLPRRLRDVGVRREHFAEIAKQAVLDGSSVFNPVVFEEEDVSKVLEEAF